MASQTSAKDSLKAAMQTSVEENRMQVAMTDESRVLLAALLRDEIKDAVAEGIRLAMTREAATQFAQVFISVMKSEASVKVDSWAGSVVKGAFKKLWDNVWIVIFAVAFVYSVGGLTAVGRLLTWAMNEALKP